MTIKEIDAKISELKQERRKLEKEEREKFKEEARKNIGRCFKINKKVFAKVIDIPQEKSTKFEIEFNPYQYPAIFLHNTETIYDWDIPIYVDTLFSGAWGIGHNLPGTIYEEITLEEFNKELEKCFEEIRNH